MRFVALRLGAATLAGAVLLAASSTTSAAPTNTQRIAALESQVAQLNARVSALEAKAAPPPSPTPTSSPASSSSALSFDDECSGTAPDPRWVSLLGPGDPGDRWDTDMLGDLRQFTASSGICTITVARTQTPSGRPFAGAMPATYGTFGQRFGTFEARIRYDEAKGTWPAFFLLPIGQKAPYPEIDVFEAYGDQACLGPGAVVSAVHYAGETISDYKVVPVTASSGWHTHRIVWTSSKIEFSIDGVVTFTETAHVPQVAMYPVLVAGVGAHDSLCRADSTTPDRLVMSIDYVRVSP